MKKMLAPRHVLGSISNHKKEKNRTFMREIYGNVLQLMNLRYKVVPLGTFFTAFAGPCFVKIVIWHVLVKIKNDEIKKSEQ